MLDEKWVLESQDGSEHAVAVWCGPRSQEPLMLSYVLASNCI